MRRSTVAVLCVLTLFFLAASAMAQQHQHGAPQPDQGWDQQRQAGQGPGRMAPWAGVSEEQQAALSALREEHHRAVLPLNLEIKAKQAQLDVLLVAPKADQAAIAAASTEITALHGRILAEKNAFRRKVFEQTGHLIGGGMDRSSMRGKGGMPARGAMKRQCPRMSMAPAAVQGQ